MASEILQKLGFSEGEGKVYSAILNSSEATLQYVHEQAGIERRNVYDIINKLINKGLVSYVNESRRKVYRATHPSKISEYLKTGQEEMAQRQAALAKEMPHLLSAYASSKPTVDARIYRGREGVRSMFDEMLSSKHHYFIGGNFGMRKYLGDSWCRNWERKRVENKIWWHDIVTAKLIMPYPKEKMEYYGAKVLPEEFYSPNVILIFGDCVANIYWGEPLHSVVIENKEVAKNYLAYFNYLWKKLKPLQKGSTDIAQAR